MTLEEKKIVHDLVLRLQKATHLLIAVVETKEEISDELFKEIGKYFVDNVPVVSDCIQMILREESDLLNMPTKGGIN